MGIFSTLQAEKRSAVYSPIHPRDPALARLFGIGKNTKAGVRVDDDTALSATAMFAGVRFIAENMATVPLKIFERVGRGSEPLRDDPRWRLLQNRPNPEQTAVEFREMVTGFVVTNGNGYAEIVEGAGGIAEELWPLVPWRVRPTRTSSGALTYLIRRPGDDNREVSLPPERILHFRGFSRNGVLGVDVIEAMKEAIGITIAADTSAAAFYGNGAQPSGYLRTDNPLSDRAWERLQKERDKLHVGVENWHRLAILEEGIQFQQISTDPEKSQLVSTRKYQIEEVARILNLPPHVLKSLERSTNNNIEHQGLELVQYSLRPWAVRLEQVYESRLLLPREVGTRQIRHELGGFLRGDLAAQANLFATGRQWGWYSINDVREQLEMNGIGPDGDVYLSPSNMLPVDKLGLLPEPGSGLGGDPGAPEPNTDRAKAWRPVFVQRMEGLVRREANAIRAALRKAERGGVVGFHAWLTEFYEENAGYLASDIRPAFEGFAPWAAPDAAKDWGRRASGVARDEVLALVRAHPLLEDLQKALEGRLAQWEVSRGSELADRELENLSAVGRVTMTTDS